MGRERRRSLELYAILAVQAGVAAALAWTLAHELLNHPSPVVRPQRRVGTIAAAIGRRPRRTLELARYAHGLLRTTWLR